MPPSNELREAFPIDRKLENWKVGRMKTTLDLPAEIVREMKMRAASEGRKLRDVATEIFRRGLAHPGPQGEVLRHRVKLPLIECPAAGTDLTAGKVAEILLKQEAEWSDETSGR